MRYCWLHGDSTRPPAIRFAFRMRAALRRERLRGCMSQELSRVRPHFFPFTVLVRVVPEEG